MPGFTLSSRDGNPPNDQQLKSAKEAGSYKITGERGLTLEVTLRGASINKSWAFRYSSPVTKKQREMGLGSYPEHSFKSVRERVAQVRALLTQGTDPLEQKREAQREADQAAEGETTLWEVAEDYIAAHSPKWKAAPAGRTMNREEAFWRGRFKEIISPIADRPVSGITKQDVARVLEPVFDKVATCDKIQKRLHAVFERAIIRDLYPPFNPAKRQVVEALVRSRTRSERRATNRPSLHWRYLPRLWSLLQSKPDTASKLLLEFVVLTGFRGVEARTLRREDIRTSADPYLGQVTYAIARTGKSQDYFQPLTAQALNTIERASRLDGKELIFPSPTNAATREKPLSENALMLYINKHCGELSAEVGGFTAHGFRATLSTWAAEHGHRKELCEAVTGHFIQTEYTRATFMSEKAALLKDYHAFITGEGR